MQDNDNKKPEADAPEVENSAVPEEATAAAESDETVLNGEPIDPQEERIAALEAELTAAKDHQLRALAEAENTRRRAQRDREEAAKYGAVGLARDLLNIADNLSRAIAAAPETADDEAVKGLIEGISMVEKELAAVLERHHVKPVPGVGEPFDHNLHQAVVELPSEDVEPGNIAQVLQTGYVLHDRLLRAGMVAVAKKPG
jgi:molecular chaperone GrpE